MFQVLDGAVGSGPRLAVTVAETTAPLANLHLRAPQEAAILQVLFLDYGEVAAFSTVTSGTIGSRGFYPSYYVLFSTALKILSHVV